MTLSTTILVNPVQTRCNQNTKRQNTIGNRYMRRNCQTPIDKILIILILRPERNSSEGLMQMFIVRDS